MTEQIAPTNVKMGTSKKLMSKLSSRVLPSATAPSNDSTNSASKLTLRTSAERYSVQKFQQLDEYCTNVGFLRLLVVLVTIPLPGLLVSLLPCFFHLQPVRDGPNAAFLLHLSCVVFVSTFGLMLTWLEVTAVPRTSYSLSELLWVCSVATLIHSCLFMLFSIYVFFPLPFSWVLGAPPLVVGIAFAHIIVFRSRLRKDPVFLDSLRSYGPSVVLQMSQLVLYPIVSMLFSNVSILWQVALTLSFPLLKWALKRQLKKLSLQLKDFSTEVAVCGIEISASLYQSMIMQSSPTPFAMALIIGFDLMQGVFHIKVFLDKYSQHLPTSGTARRLSSAVATTIGIQPAQGSGSGVSVVSQASRQELILLARQLLHTTRIASVEANVVITDRTIASNVGNQNETPMATQFMPMSEKRRTLAVALETLYVAEEILLTEYFEVVIPITNLIFILIASQMPSARFNPRLALYYADASLLATAVQSIALYSLLQGVTLLLMHWVMRYRYGISALSCLAFILERHALSITGKMIAWLPFILHFTVVQYGVDFTFKFTGDVDTSLAT